MDGNLTNNRVKKTDVTFFITLSFAFDDPFAGQTTTTAIRRPFIVPIRPTFW